MTTPLNNKLVQIKVTYDGKGLTYSKPAFQKNDDAYALKDDGCKLELYLNRSKLTFPISLQFSLYSENSNNGGDTAEYVISGLGFELCTPKFAQPEPTKVTAPGTKMAGDCFLLDEGVDALNVGVLNQGTDHKPGYAFKLWIRDPDKPGSEIGFDPRVYNHAEIGPIDFENEIWNQEDLKTKNTLIHRIRRAGGALASRYLRPILSFLRLSD